MPLRGSAGGRPQLAKTAALRLATTSPAAPPQIPATIAGLQLWLDSSITPLPLGTPVPIAPDRSGQGRGCTADPSQAIPTYQPGAFGSLGALLCPGQSEYLIGGSPIVLVGPCAVLAVVSRSPGASFFGLNPASLAEVNGYQGPGVCCYSDGRVYAGDDTGSSVQAPQPGSSSGPSILRWIRSPGGWWFQCTGQSLPLELQPGAMGTVTASSLVHRQGPATDGGTDLVGEVLVYSADLATEDLGRLIAYLATKWGVPA